MTIAAGPVPSWARPMLAPAATASSRFFGLTADNSNAKPSAAPGFMVSMAAIHLGSSASSPGPGRPRHCFTAISSRSAPTISWMVPTTGREPPVSGSGRIPPSRVNATTATPMPTTQPPRKLSPRGRGLGDISIKMVAIIGIGLMATARASGRMSPMTAFMFAPRFRRGVRGFRSGVRDAWRSPGPARGRVRQRPRRSPNPPTAGGSAG